MMAGIVVYVLIGCLITVGLYVYEVRNDELYKIDSIPKFFSYLVALILVVLFYPIFIIKMTIDRL